MANTTDDDVDDEIIDIFVEEAGEVLECLDSYFPKWQSDPSDRTVLGDIRRAYHTLKGSGRMAKAMELAEIAWKVEQCLNKALEGSLEVTPTMVQMVMEARQEFPPLLSSLEKRQPLSLPEGYLMQVFSRIDAVTHGTAVAAAPVNQAPAQAGASQQALDALTADLRALASRLDGLQGNSDQALAEARALAAKVVHLEGVVSTAASRNDTERLRNQLDKSMTDMTELRAGLKTLADKVQQPADHKPAALEQRLTREIATLRTDNNRLTGEVERLTRTLIQARQEAFRFAAISGVLALVGSVTALFLLR